MTTFASNATLAGHTRPGVHWGTKLWVWRVGKRSRSPGMASMILLGWGGGARPVQHLGGDSRVRHAAQIPDGIGACGSNALVWHRTLATGLQTPLWGTRRRVLVVTPQPFYQDRGSPIALHAVLSALSERGYAVDLLSFPCGRSLEIPGVRHFRTANPLGFHTIPIGFSLKKLFLDVLLLRLLYTRLRQEPYQCVYAVEEAAFGAVVLCRRSGIRVIYDMESSLPEQLAQHTAFRSRPVQALCRHLERWLLRNVQSVTCSAGLAAHVSAVAPGTPIHEWHFPSTPPAVSPEDVTALRDALRLPVGARVVLYSGTFAPYQGVQVLVDAIPRVVADVPQAVFILVGSTPEEQAVWAQRLSGLAIERHIRLLPRQSRARMEGFLAVAEVLVSPRAYGANLPLKIFDYLATGKPIVASDIPAHRAVLDATRAVLVPLSAAAFARAITHLLTHPEDAARLSVAAHAYANERLRWSTFVETVDVIYAAVCSSASF
jgi:glycosyltransferase involved in cell wall biosynthesis